MGISRRMGAFLLLLGLVAVPARGIAQTAAPFRAARFERAPVPLADGVRARRRAEVRPTAVGALVGGVVGAALGFAAGYSIDNIERSGPRRAGHCTFVGTATGAAIGVLLGSGVGWLIER